MIPGQSEVVLRGRMEASKREEGVMVTRITRLTENGCLEPRKIKVKLEIKMNLLFSSERKVGFLKTPILRVDRAGLAATVISFRAALAQYNCSTLYFKTRNQHSRLQDVPTLCAQQGMVPRKVRPLMHVAPQSLAQWRRAQATLL